MDSLSLSSLLLVPGWLLIILCAVPAGRHKVREACEPFLLRTVYKQLGAVLQVQEWRCKPLDVLARASAASVSIEGYLIGLPLLFLLGYEDEACLLASALALTTHIICALKDLLCGPRPAHAYEHAVATKQLDKGSKPGVVVMESERDVEFGCPSMHVALVLVMNGYAVHLLLQYLPLQGPLLYLLLGAAATWVAGIAWGRLYLGVHSPIDLAGGVAVGLASLALWLLGGRAWLHFHKAHPWAFVAHFIGCLWLLATYPKPPINTTSYTFTVVFCGAELGVLGPLSATFWASPIPSLITQVVQAAPRALRAVLSRMATNADFPWLALRLAGGVASVFISLEVSKALLVAILPRLFSLFPTWARAAWQPPVSVVYASIGERIKHKEEAEASATTDDTASVGDSKQNGQRGGGGLFRRLGSRGREKKAESDAAAQADAKAASLGERKKELAEKEFASSKNGILLRPDGYPYDADVARRVGSYCCAVASLAFWVRSIDAAAQYV